MGDEDGAGLRKATRFISLGVEVAGAVGGATFLGYWMDDWLKTTPLFILVLVLGSSVAVFWHILRMIRLLDRGGK